MAGDWPLLNPQGGRGTAPVTSVCVCVCVCVGGWVCEGVADLQYGDSQTPHFRVYTILPSQDALRLNG